jgi:archaellum biogenesis ATPase FlaH
MLDAKLIAASLQSRRAFEKLAQHTDPKELTAPAGFWFGVLREWYTRDQQAKSVDKSLLAEQGRSRISNPKHVETLMGFLAELPEAPSPENVATVILELKRHNVGMELAAAIAANDGKRVSALHPKYGELLQATELREKARYEDAAGWDELDALVGDDKRIPIAPLVLNEKLGGGALPGHSILLFGRPEIAKSTISLNMAAGFLHSGQRTGYLGNEDNINVLKKRMRCRLSDMTQAEVNKDPDKANRLAYARERSKGGELSMRHIHGGTMSDIERFCDEFEPTVLILDQIRNVKSADSELVRRLEVVGQEWRDLLAQRGIVGIAVTQASASAEDKLWLGMDDVDSSKTGLPGAMDAMVGIGANQDYLKMNRRALSLPKNKLSDKPNNHEGVTVEIDLQRSKVVG